MHAHSDTVQTHRHTRTLTHMHVHTHTLPPSNMHTHAVVNNDLGKAITDHESECNFSSTYYHEFLATHMEAQATFEQFTQALNLNTDQLTESLASGMKSDAELSGEGMMKNVITRDMMVRTLRELKYNSLAVAMETGTLKKLDPTPVIVELRNLHASLF